MRFSEEWMDFGAGRSSLMGVDVIRAADRVRAGLSGEAVRLPGRSGDLFIADGGYQPFEVEVLLKLRPGADVFAVSKWLTGAGNLRFSDMPEYVYRARAVREFAYERWMPGAGGQWFSVRFACQPFLYKAVPTSTAVVSGGTVTNAGNVASFPMIQLTGTGTVALSIGAESLVVSGLNGQINIDCEARIATNTGGGLMTGQLTPPSDWAMLKPGGNAVSFSGTVAGLRVYDNSMWV